MMVALSGGDWQGGIYPSAEERRAWFEHINGAYVSRDVLLWWRRYARTLGVQLSSATTILMPSGTATCRQVHHIREKLLISILTYLPEEMLGRYDTFLINLLIDAPETAGTAPGKLRVQFRGDRRQMRLPDAEGAIRAVLQPLLPDIVTPILEGATACSIGLRLRVPRVASNRELVDMICELREI
ncbi:hypothetical protein [Azospirillum sp. TSH100]|uniref:hypothetical protein n=1 Tax=Azospirillum sp. TSH100 TaxID=652764 RepID=UPI0010A9D59E|nr:hypothetical protein [Azospirillum sp. TSH100]QCG89149.1 hypothetical protein E6C72_15150 [Azospirillum sp. TSH100]